jgi:hypothetical protein
MPLRHPHHSSFRRALLLDEASSNNLVRVGGQPGSIASPQPLYAAKFDHLVKRGRITETDACVLTKFEVLRGLDFQWLESRDAFIKEGEGRGSMASVLEGGIVVSEKNGSSSDGWLIERPHPPNGYATHHWGNRPEPPGLTSKFEEGKQVTNPASPDPEHENIHRETRKCFPIEMSQRASPSPLNAAV